MLDLSTWVVGGINNGQDKGAWVGVWGTGRGGGGLGQPTQDSSEQLEK